MVEELYSPIRTESMKSVLRRMESERGIRSLVLDENLTLSSELIQMAYVRDLKMLLEIDDLFEIAEKILALQKNLRFLSKRVDGGSVVMPDLNVFYSILSPLLLENLILEERESLPKKDLQGQVSRDQVFKRWMESIRIAIERELHEFFS